MIVFVGSGFRVSIVLTRRVNLRVSVAKPDASRRSVPAGAELDIIFRCFLCLHSGDAIRNTSLQHSHCRTKPVWCKGTKASKVRHTEKMAMRPTHNTVSVLDVGIFTLLEFWILWHTARTGTTDRVIRNI